MGSWFRIGSGDPSLIQSLWVNARFLPRLLRVWIAMVNKKRPTHRCTNSMEQTKQTSYWLSDAIRIKQYDTILNRTGWGKHSGCRQPSRDYMVYSNTLVGQQLTWNSLDWIAWTTRSEPFAQLWDSDGCPQSLIQSLCLYSCTLVGALWRTWLVSRTPFMSSHISPAVCQKAKLTDYYAFVVFTELSSLSNSRIT